MRAIPLPPLYWIIAAVWAVSYTFFRRARAWLIAYMLGAIGFTLLAVYALRSSAVESFIEKMSAVAAHYLCNVINIPTKVFFNAPGTLLVLIVHQKVGWTAVEKIGRASCRVRV